MKKKVRKKSFAHNINKWHIEKKCATSVKTQRNSQNIFQQCKKKYCAHLSTILNITKTLMNILYCAIGVD